MVCHSLQNGCSARPSIFVVILIWDSCCGGDEKKFVLRTFVPLSFSLQAFLPAKFFAGQTINSIMMAVTDEWALTMMDSISHTHMNVQTYNTIVLMMFQGFGRKHTIFLFQFTTKYEACIVVRFFPSSNRAQCTVKCMTVSSSSLVPPGSIKSRLNIIHQ